MEPKTLYNMNSGKAIIITAPSGCGKSSVTKALLKEFSELDLSTSFTTRKPRGEEKDGKEYFFIPTVEEFMQKQARGEIFESNEVYPGAFYGTPQSEVDRIWNSRKTVLFDIDAFGAGRVKNILGKNALTIFLTPEHPELTVLRQRLEARGTETSDQIAVRLHKANIELLLKDDFDLLFVNQTGHLQETIDLCSGAVKQFLHE